jgi:hypothetical protein
VAVVGPLRALFVAEGQALYNRLRREAGGAGLAGAVLVAILIPLALAAPTAGSFVVGASVGRDVTHPTRGGPVLLELSGVLTLIPLCFGFLGGILGGDDEGGLSLRGYPVSRRKRLAARFLSYALELPSLLALSCLAGLAAGLCLRQPAASPLALLLGAQGAAWVLIVQYAARGLRTLGLGRPLMTLSALIAFGLVVVMTRGRPLLAAVGRLLQDSLPYLPTTLGVAGLADLTSGQMMTAWVRQIPVLALTAVAIEITARHAARAEEDGPGPRRKGQARERLWSFDHPAKGIARLFVSTVAQSRQGLTLVLLPPFIVGMIVSVSSLIAGDARRAPLPPSFARLLPESLAGLPVFGLLPFLLVHMNSELWLNQWGWDGRAVRTLFTAPIAVRHLLLGKLMGLGTIVSAQYLMAAPLLALLRRPRAAELLWGLGAGTFALFVIAGLGHVLSAGLSRPLDARGRISRTENFAAMIGGLLALTAAVAPVFFTYAVARPWGEWGLFVGMWALAVTGAAFYWLSLSFLAERVRDMREQFLEAA